MARRKIQIPTEASKTSTSFQSDALESLENMVVQLINRWNKHDKAINETLSDIKGNINYIDNNKLNENINYVNSRIDENINNIDNKLSENINDIGSRIVEVKTSVRDSLNKPSLFKRIINWIKKKVFRVNE